MEILEKAENLRKNQLSPRIANPLFQQHKRRLYTWASPDIQYRNQTDYTVFSRRQRSSIQSPETRLQLDYISNIKLTKSPRKQVYNNKAPLVSKLGNEHSSTVPTRIHSGKELPGRLCGNTVNALEIFLFWFMNSTSTNLFYRNNLGHAQNFVHETIYGSCCYCLVTQSCLILCICINCSTPGFPVLYHLPELAQTHVH